MRRESERTFVLRFETKNLCSEKNLPRKTKQGRRKEKTETQREQGKKRVS